MATIGDLWANQADLRDEVRRRLGVTAAILDDAAADALIDETLRVFNRRCADLNVGTFLTVANQQEYNPLPVDAYAVRRAWWPSPSCGVNEVFDKLLARIEPLLTSQPFMVPGGVAVRNGAAEPAAVYRVIRRERWLDRMLGATTRIFNGRTIRLVPEPSKSGETVVFTYSSPPYSSVFDVEEVESWFLCLIWRYLEGAAVGAAGAGDITQVRDPITGVAVTRGSSSTARDAARDAQRAFLRSCQTPMPMPPGRFPR